MLPVVNMTWAVVIIIIMNLREIGLGGTDWIGLAQDRDQ
jgi:hypothetical protein